MSGLSVVNAVSPAIAGDGVLQRMAADVARAERGAAVVDCFSKRLICVRFENVYGRLTCYPVDVQAKLFAQIAGTKTLTRETLLLVEQLGFVIDLYGSPHQLQTFLRGGS